jgi:hypothetical protein
MLSKTSQSNANPLTSYMRQPKIYISLPSQGNFWPEKSIDMPENNELPVYSMTAKDELLFKTPDALMNGQSIVDVIQSCVPNIKNAWVTPSIDLDTILIAIRIATYGEYMEFTHKIPAIFEDLDYGIDLKTLLSQQQNNHWIDQVVINPDFIICVKPLTYKHLTQASIKTFEMSRILNIANDDQLSDEQKLQIFEESFKKLSEVTIGLVTNSIYKIITPDGEVVNRAHITEYIENADKSIVESIQNHINELKKHNDLAPLEFTTTEEQQAQGAPAAYTVPINFNNSDFFGNGF